MAISGLFLAVLFGSLAVALAVFLFIDGWRALQRQKVAESVLQAGCWEHVPAEDEHGVYGWRVRWSEPDEEGNFYWCGHYLAGPATGLMWCEHAAETHARRLNLQVARPVAGYSSRWEPVAPAGQKFGQLEDS